MPENFSIPDIITAVLGQGVFGLTAFFVAGGALIGILLLFTFVHRKRKNSQKGEYLFPVELLAFSSALTLFAVLWATGNGIYFGYEMSHEVRQNLEINNTGSRIIHLDETITHALRMYALTGDPKWEKTYYDNSRLLNETLKKLKDLAARETVRPGESISLLKRADAIDQNTDFFLQASEAKVVDLARAGKLADARAILIGEDFIIRKQDYSNSLYEIGDDAEAILGNNLNVLARNSSFSLYPGILVIMILPFAWYFTYQSVRRWHEELENARKTLIENEKQLQKSICEIEMSQTEALKAREAAEKASKAKSEFLANMSHELRTPLNSILGMLRFLKDGQVGEEERGLVETAFRSSTNLLEIVNDILDLSKIEAGEMRLEHIGMDLAYAIHSTVLTLGHIAKNKQISLFWHEDKDKLPYVLGDPSRFLRILTNLVGNGIKYTDKGRVDIYTRQKQLDDTHIEFRCEVKDTGIGIPKEKLQSIFEKFVQADTSTTRKYGGTGLGLAITKQLVELMGGTIGVESEPGTGSVFWFSIPFETTEKLDEEKYIRRSKMASGTIRPAAARILIAEDHPMNQILMTKLLKRFGIGNFEIAENGTIAARRYSEAPWDVILMDCHMPEMNGYDATEQIRKFEKTTGKHTPIIAMTANAMVGDKEKCLRYGMDEYLSKPINIDQLKEILGQWIHFEDLAEGTKSMAVTAADAPVDLAQIKSYSEGDKEMEKEMIRIFVEQSDKNLQSLAAHKEDGGSKIWKDTAHMFKGGAAGVGGKKLSGLCSEAQHFNGTIEEQIALFHKIDGEYTRVKDYFKTIGLLS